MSLNWGLVDFMLDNYASITTSPINGSLHDIYVIYSMFMQNFLWKNNECGETYFQFCEDLNQISEVCGGCMNFEDDSGGNIFGQKISFIDGDSLKILQKVHYDQAIKLSLSHTGNKAKKIAIDKDSVQVKERKIESEPILLNKLMGILDQSETITPNAKCLRHLNQILSLELGSTKLSKEQAKLNTKRSPFIPICSDPKHVSLLSTVINTVNNKIMSLQSEKLKKIQSDCQDIIECSNTHIHFIPNLKPQTDLSLGDCSYLDTCHKLSTCRYVHYLQYYPESLQKQKIEEQKEQVKQHSFYTHGECCSSSFKKPLPPQWIKCDVRKFDFDILGKFSAVIADPAWNIHMNLPYGTCNDNELLQLPFDLLQDEGLLFLWVTGRAIEVGKESLQNWGYEVINEISWIKTNQLGRTIVTGRTGHWLNHSKEHLLVGVKGNPEWLNRKIDIDLIISATRETSRKPDELYGIIERLVGTHARKLEIFGRDHNIRPGWFTIGNQVTGSSIHEVDVKRKYERFMEKSKNSKTN
ncbi:Ime4 [Kluyveromyces lactis]|nr:Ime4 [Kluyveromyces lactis]